MRRCEILAGWVVLLLGVLGQPVSAETVLQLTPAETTSASEVKISWRADGATSAFLSGFGNVEPSGSRTFQAVQSQTFVLVSEGPEGIRMASERLEVQGGKGSDSLPSPSEFRSPLQKRLTVKSFTALCDGIHDVLQDDLKFTVTYYQIPREKFVFLVEPSVRPELIRPTDKKIRKRQLAYLVEIPLPGALPAEVQVTIQTWMQYQRWIEKNWRVEGDEELHRQASEHLWQLIDAMAKRRKP